MSNHKKCHLSGAGPYVVWECPGAPGAAGILDERGYNCLRFEDCGAVFTDIESARQIAHEWNQAG